MAQERRVTWTQTHEHDVATRLRLVEIEGGIGRRSLAWFTYLVRADRGGRQFNTTAEPYMTAKPCINIYVS